MFLKSRKYFSVCFDAFAVRALIRKPNATKKSPSECSVVYNSSVTKGFVSTSDTKGEGGLG